jgi:hypothetical protein
MHDETVKFSYNIYISVAQKSNFTLDCFISEYYSPAIFQTTLHTRFLPPLSPEEENILFWDT